MRRKDVASRPRPILGGVLFAVALPGGCAVGKPVPEATLYAIEPAPPAPATSLPRRPQTLTMGRVRVAPAYGGKSLVFRVDGVRYASDFYSAFIAAPDDMLASRIAEWLDRAGPLKAVVQPGTRHSPSHVLDAVVTELYGDFRPDHRPEAVMKIQFRLLDLTGVRPRAMLEQSIGRRIPLPEETPDALVRGYGDALSQILEELMQQLAGTH